MAEGGLNAPVRHPIDWNNPDFFDWDKINGEMERVFDICHGCRRCFKPFNPGFLSMSSTSLQDFHRLAWDLRSLDLVLIARCPVAAALKWSESDIWYP